jgi:hypothetical protein
MIRISFFQLISLLFVVSLLNSCANDNPPKTKGEKPNEKPKSTPTEKENTEEQIETFDMSNPAFMMGTNLGILFKTYYKVGDYSKMLAYTSSSTIKKYGAEKLRNIYRNLDLGYDMKLTNMTTEGNEKILHYEIVINATKQVKRLHVIIENDTARVVPQHLERGEIFE